MEQLQAYSGKSRDPRGYSVSLVYFALVPHQDVKPEIETVDESVWLEFTDIESYDLAFDHKEIIFDAYQRLQQKALYTMLPVYCLTNEFTVSELMAVIKAIIGKNVQRKSLIRRIESSKMFEKAGLVQQGVGRSSQVYRVLPNVDIYHFERNLSF